MKIWNSPGRKNTRRKVALKGLKSTISELQGYVETGKYPEAVYGLEDKIKKAKKNISILEERIVTDEVARSTKRKKNRRTGIM